MADKVKILKDVLKFTSARYISQAIGFFSAIALRRFLGPFQMGIWSLLKVVLGYASYLTLGVNKGAAVKIPLHAGEGNTESEENVKNTVFTFTLIAAGLTSIGLVVAAFILRDKYPVEVIVGLFALSVFMLLSSLCTFYQILLRAKHNFSTLSKSIVFEAIINLILILLLVRKYEMYGLYITLIVVAFLNLIFMHFFARYRAKFVMDWAKLRVLWDVTKVGIPIVVVSLLYWVLESLDRIMIAKMIGITYVGYYSIPIMAKAYVGQLSSFSTVLYPRLMETHGKEQDVKKIEKYAVVPTRINAYILPFILGVIFFVVPLLVTKILPKYVPGILAMQILLLGMFFETCRGQAFFFVVALKKQVRVIPIAVAAIILNIIGNYVFIKKGYGIYGVAAATSFVSFLGFVGLQIYAMKHFSRMKEIALFLLEVTFPIIYTAIVAVLLNRFLRLENMYMEVVVKSLLLGVFSLPLFVYINKKSGIFKLLFNVIGAKISPKKGGKNDKREE